MNKNTLLYAGLLIFGLIGAFVFPAYKLQLSFLYILIVLAMTWDVQGGQNGFTIHLVTYYFWYWNVCCFKHSNSNVLFSS